MMATSSDVDDDDVYLPWSGDELVSSTQMMAEAVISIEDELQDESGFTLTNIVPSQPPELDPIR